jgi:hypothetical protein
LKAFVVNGEHSPHFPQDLVEARLFGFEPALQRAAAKLERATCGVCIGLAFGHEFGEHAF